MAKVRVYDLAKEFGLKSKELADQLIAQGYPIVSHSSSLEDDQAEEIRKKLAAVAVASAEPVSRIVAKAKPEASSAWGSTVVRRRSKADKEEAARQQELAEIKALEEEAQAAEARLLREEEEKIPEAAPEEIPAAIIEENPVIPPVMPPAAAENGGPGENQGEAPVQEEISAREEGAVPEKSEAAQEQGTPEPDTRKESAAQAAVSTPGPAPQAGRQKNRKDRGTQGQREKPRQIARVVGRVEIPLPSEPARPEGRPARSAEQRNNQQQPRPQQPRQNAMPGDSGVDFDAVERGQASRGKKKEKGGRRVVAIADEDAQTGRTPRGIGGGRRARDVQDDFGDTDGEYIRRRKGKKKKDQRAEQREPQAPATETKAIKRRIKVVENITVADLAKHMSVKSGEVISALMKLGVMATLNQALDVDTAALVATDFGFTVEQAMYAELELEALEEMEEERGGEPSPRPPVVTVMGHVDHGKTSILDAIRKTDVAAGEAGGITQHIGAYHVQSAAGNFTFVDTPGHAAFTEMRSRGAKVTDIVVLVVAADDGVMDQTKEAIAHAQAAEVPIVVAVNKIDKEGADGERVRRELSDYGLLPEAWGGQTIYCDTSAKKGTGITDLLESIQVQAEILELKADPSRKARGVVLEAQLHKGRGPVATVLVQEGTLRPGDNFVAGMYSGKVRMLTNDRGEQVKEAGPAIPVEVQGLSGVPQAGDKFMVLTDEKMAKSVAAARQLKVRETELAAASKVSLDNLFEKIAEQEIKELRVILRADVQGTLEAFGQAAEKLSTETIRVRSLHEATGSITENDIHLAAASNAIVIGFNVRPSLKVKELAEREGVDVRSYDVIYHALEDIEKAMKGMLEPTYEERVIGTAEVRQTFQVPKIGMIAGCGVIAGKVTRSARVRVLRDGVVVYTGKIGSLKRFKDDAREVLTGFECGINVENFNDIKVGDQLEAFVMDEVEATL